jgi:hypothetical protein
VSLGYLAAWCSQALDGAPFGFIGLELGFQMKQREEVPQTPAELYQLQTASVVAGFRVASDQLPDPRAVDEIDIPHVENDVGEILFQKRIDLGTQTGGSGPDR